MFRSILVPLDGSGFAEQALSYALLLARQSGARLRLVRVHEPPLPMEFAAELPMAFYEEDASRAREWEALGALAASLSAGWGVPATARLRDGDPVAALAREAAECEADLVVMSTHGRGPIARAWLGSVADALLRSIEVPLLLVRPRERDAEAEHAPRPPFRRILVPLDGSDLAAAALEPAAALAAESGAALTLLHVVPAAAPVLTRFALAGVGLDEGDIVAYDHSREEARLSLERAGRQLDVPTECVVAAGIAPAAAILRFARAAGADLIAMSTHGHGGFARLLHGSVTDAVVRGASTPVLVVRP